MINNAYFSQCWTDFSHYHGWTMEAVGCVMIPTELWLFKKASKIKASKIVPVCFFCIIFSLFWSVFLKYLPALIKMTGAPEMNNGYPEVLCGQVHFPCGNMSKWKMCRMSPEPQICWRRAVFSPSPCSTNSNVREAKMTENRKVRLVRAHERQNKQHPEK